MSTLDSLIWLSRERRSILTASPHRREMAVIAFIGLGIMGDPMAGQLSGRDARSSVGTAA
jgi:hypothetical protein